MQQDISAKSAKCWLLGARNETRTELKAPASRQNDGGYHFAGSDAWSHAKEWQEWAGKHIAADNVPPVVLSDEHLKDITGYQIIDDSRQCVRVYRAGHITERSLTQIVTLLAVAGVKTVYEYAGITDTSPADLSDQLPRLKDEYERGESLVLPLKKKSQKARAMMN